MNPRKTHTIHQPMKIDKSSYKFIRGEPVDISNPMYKSLHYSITFTGSKNNIDNKERKIVQYKNTFVFKNKNLMELSKLTKRKEISSMLYTYKDVSSGFQKTFDKKDSKLSKPQLTTYEQLQNYLEDLNNLHNKLDLLKTNKLVNLQKLRLKRIENNLLPTSHKIKSKTIQVDHKYNSNTNTSRDIKTSLPEIRTNFSMKTFEKKFINSNA